jgi:hypothetical protein
MRSEARYLYEEVVLLALRGREGTFVSSTSLPYALAGAIAAELLLQGRIEADASKKRTVRVRSKEPLGDPLLDECLLRIAAAKRPSSLATWITRFAGMRGLPHRAVAVLCREGTLREERGKVLFLFTRRTYPAADPRAGRALREKLRRALLSDSQGVDHRTRVLVALARGGSLLGAILDRDERKARKERIERLIATTPTGKATKEAIEAAKSARAAAYQV